MNEPIILNNHTARNLILKTDVVSFGKLGIFKFCLGLRSNHSPSAPWDFLAQPEPSTQTECQVDNQNAESAKTRRSHKSSQDRQTSLPKSLIECIICTNTKITQFLPRFHTICQNTQIVMKLDAMCPRALLTRRSRAITTPMNEQAKCTFTYLM